MQRRRLVFSGLATLVAPFFASAQARKIPRVGVILAHAMPNSFMEGFQRGLRELGYVEGRNIHVEYRSAAGSSEKYPLRQRLLEICSE